MNISVVIPAKNEQDNVLPLVEEIVRALQDIENFEIVYVDDGSSDNTYANLRFLQQNGYPQVTVIQHQQSVGQSTAIHTGIAFARGNLIVTMDADAQNDPADIPKMLTAARRFSAGADFCIAGYRKARQDTSWKRLQSRIANGVRSKILGDQTPDTGCGLKVMPKATFMKLPYFDHMHRFLPALVKRLGGEVVVVVVNHRNRQHGVSKYNMLGRLGVGIVDMLGVLWLQKRCKLAEVIPIDECSEVKRLG